MDHEPQPHAVRGNELQIASVACACLGMTLLGIVFGIAAALPDDGVNVPPHGRWLFVLVLGFMLPIGTAIAHVRATTKFRKWSFLAASGVAGFGFGFLLGIMALSS